MEAKTATMMEVAPIGDPRIVRPIPAATLRRGVKRS